MLRWAEFWDRFRRNRGALVGLGILVAILMMAAAAPFLYPGDPAEILGLVVYAMGPI